jgi:hypothetical protein
MINLDSIISNSLYDIQKYKNGFNIEFLDNNVLINFFNIIKINKSFYIHGQEFFYVYRDVVFIKSNTNTRQCFYKCVFKVVNKQDFLPYTRKEKIKDMWSDIDSV